MRVVIRSENEFAAWFRRNLEQFGWEKALVDYQGSRRKPFPDYYCYAPDGWSGGCIDPLPDSLRLLLGRELVLVELELLSHNFVAHDHDPDGCDLVVAAEDNWSLYGDRAPVPVLDVGLSPVPPAMLRCRYHVRRMLASPDPVAVAPALGWFEQAAEGEERQCFCCKKAFADRDRLGRVNWRREVLWHRQCEDVVRSRLRHYVGMVS